jgi:hypothetical protein
VFAGVVVVRVAIPAALPRVPGPGLLGTVNAEIVGSEPPNPERRSRDTTREVAVVVVGDDDSVRRDFETELGATVRFYM